jgi:TatA/E family protein of Tat protein translocase
VGEVTVAFFEIGFGEMMVVAFIALLLFGGELPRVMRSLGDVYRGFRKSMDDLRIQALRPDAPRPTKPAASTPYRPTSMPLPPPAGVALTPPAMPSVAPEPPPRPAPVAAADPAKPSPTPPSVQDDAPLV